MRSSLALITLATSVAVAQPPSGGGAQRSSRLSIGGGATVPIGGFADAHDLGLNAQGSLHLSFGTLPFQLRGDLSYSRFKISDIAKVVQQSVAQTTGKSELLGGLANMSFNLGSGPVHPYVLVGLGALKVKNTIDDKSVALSKSSSLEFTVNGGAGLALRLGRLDAFLEGRIANVYTDRGVIDTKSIRAIPITFGVFF